MNCKWHLCENNVLEGRKFCSQKCKNKFGVQKRKIKLKLLAIKYKGGKCELCGYDKCPDAFEFHHQDTNEKDFGISQKGHTISWERLTKEVEKCLMLCANCHRETHFELKKTKYIYDIINTEDEPVLTIRRETNLCIDCSTEISREATRCIPCYQKTIASDSQNHKNISKLRPVKINWPEAKELKELVWSTPRSALAKALGVSDKAIAKRCNKLGIEQPPRGYWAKKRARKL